MGTRISPRTQGDIGELSALAWHVEQGAKIYLPWGHSPDVDMVANWGDRLSRIQVKTSSYWRDGRWEAALATRGGNQSWNGIVKRFAPGRCDELFVHVADGRRWLIPAAHVGGGCAIKLGGPKYAGFEIEPGQPFEVLVGM